MHRSNASRFVNHRSPFGSRRGNYAILVGVSFSALMGFGAIAVDSAWVNLAYVQAQAAADAGAHAAVISLRQGADTEEARDVAEAVINANNLMGAAALVEPAEDIIFGGWDYDARAFDPAAAYTNAVRVNVRKTDDSPNGALQTLLVRLFGTEYSEAGASAPSTAALRFREIMIVQDITGSFRDEIGDARTADLAFLDEIKDHNNPGDRIGMVTFVGAAEVWTDLSYVDADYGAIYTQWETLDWCNRNYAPWIGQPAYYHDAPHMLSCNAGQTSTANPHYDSGTNQGSGIIEAVTVLADEGSSNPHALKTIVLVSDGKPQCTPSSTSCDASVAAEGYDAADMAEDESISIFAVSFNYPHDPIQSAYMESLVRGYGKFYETPDSEDLEEILEDIARSIPIALVE